MKPRPAVIKTRTDFKEILFKTPVLHVKHFLLIFIQLWLKNIPVAPYGVLGKTTLNYLLFKVIKTYACVLETRRNCHFQVCIAQHNTLATILKTPFSKALVQEKLTYTQWNSSFQTPLHLPLHSHPHPPSNKLMWCFVRAGLFADM